MTISRILCPIDLSDFSRPALAHAVALGRCYDADVIALHVFAAVMPPATLGTYPAWMLQIPEGRDAIVQELRSILEPFTTTGTALRLHTAEGDAAGQIVGHASELQADLIVIGTHGRGGFDRFTLGSVAEKVLRKAPCPVMTLPPGAAPAAAVAYRSILCPTDFSWSSERGIDLALSLARRSHATVTVLHVVETDDEDADVRRGDSDAEALHSMLASRVQPSDTVSELVATGTPHREILRVADECDADLIVIGVRGRGAVDLTLFGSTTNQVVRRATCPVITVRSRGEES
ncbi:MAG TPA: universal stress protein [Vicinamibacterales bacterium]|nr:universal stress protein [Vicinamibacterales bacterium]